MRPPRRKSEKDGRTHKTQERDEEKWEEEEEEVVTSTHLRFKMLVRRFRR